MGDDLRELEKRLDALEEECTDHLRQEILIERLSSLEERVDTLTDAAVVERVSLLERKYRAIERVVSRLL